MMNNLSINIAVSETTDSNSAISERIYRKIQNAIDNNAFVLYNGNDEECIVPLLCPIRYLHSTSVKDSEEFEGEFAGWEMDDISVVRIIMIEQCRTTQKDFLNLVTNTLSKELLEYWASALEYSQSNQDENFPIFLGEGCIALHIDLSDNTWFEYIIDNASKQ